MPKYRIWVSANERYDASFIVKQDGSFQSESTLYSSSPEHGFIVEQSTGQFDRRGDEIYVGDILMNHKGKKVLIKEKIDGFMAKVINQNKTFISFRALNDYVKIGTIHDKDVE